MNYVDRRKRFLSALKSPVLLMAGGLLGRNYPANTFPYRADSTFLYFFERPEAGSAAFFDPATGKVTLFAIFSGGVIVAAVCAKVRFWRRRSANAGSRRLQVVFDSMADLVLVKNDGLTLRDSRIVCDDL